MGWSGSQGLGAQGQGRVEPVRLQATAGLSGVGLREDQEEKMNDEKFSRKRLEIEREETPEVISLRAGPM